MKQICFFLKKETWIIEESQQFLVLRLCQLQKVPREWVHIQSSSGLLCSGAATTSCLATSSHNTRGETLIKPQAKCRHFLAALLHFSWTFSFSRDLQPFWQTDLNNWAETVSGGRAAASLTTTQSHSHQLSFTCHYRQGWTLTKLLSSLESCRYCAPSYSLNKELWKWREDVKCMMDIVTVKSYLTAQVTTTLWGAKITWNNGNIRTTTAYEFWLLRRDYQAFHYKSLHIPEMFLRQSGPRPSVSIHQIW